MTDPLPTDSLPKDAHGRYLRARELAHALLRQATPDGGELAVPRALLKALTAGYPPDPELPTSHARFAARWVPFLRAAMRDTGHRFDFIGVTVLRHPQGGVLLLALDGRFAALAHDPEGSVSEGGCRVEMPDAFMDRCVPPVMPALVNEGDVWSPPPPPWLMPDRVLAAGASLLLTHQDRTVAKDGGHDGLLAAAMVETGNIHRTGEDARLHPPALRADTLAHLFSADLVPFNGPLTFSTAAVRVIAEAGTALGAHGWHFGQCGLSTVARPLFWSVGDDDARKEETRDALLILAPVAPDCGRGLDDGLPDWLTAVFPPRAAEPAVPTPAEGSAA